MLHSRRGSSSGRGPGRHTPNIESRTVREARQVALPIVALGVVIAMLYFGRVFFITSIVAVVIAFILEPFVTLLMRARFPRSVAAFVVCSVGLLFLYVIGYGGLFAAFGPLRGLPRYGQRIGDLVDGFRQKIQGMEERTYRMVLPARQRQQEEEQIRAQQAAAKSRKAAKASVPAFPLPPPLPPSPLTERIPIGEYLYSRLGSFYQILLMASFVPFLVYFMLSWQDHINRSFLQFFHGEDRLVAARSMHGIGDMVRAFVVGNFLLGLLLAFFSSIMFWIVRLPYPLLVGPLSGFLSLVPYVGLPRPAPAAVFGLEGQYRPGLRVRGGLGWLCCT